MLIQTTTHTHTCMHTLRYRQAHLQVLYPYHSELRGVKEVCALVWQCVCFHGAHIVNWVPCITATWYAYSISWTTHRYTFPYLWINSGIIILALCQGVAQGRGEYSGWFCLNFWHFNLGKSCKNSETRHVLSVVPRLQVTPQGLWNWCLSCTSFK